MVQTDSETNHIESINTTGRIINLSPSENFDNEIICYLYDRDIIIVNPLSPISAFEEKSDFKSFLYRDVSWVVNVSITNSDRLTLEDVFKLIYVDIRGEVQSEWKDELKDLIYLLSEEEVLKYLSYSLQQLQLPEAPKKTKEVIVEILKEFSVSEIYYFVKKSVDNAHLFFAKGNADGKRHAVNTIPSKLIQLANRAKNEGWNVYKYNRTYFTERSQLSVVVFDLVIEGADDVGFYTSPEDLWINQVSKRFPPLVTESESTSVCCVICDSENISINSINGNISIDCNECGESSLYSVKQN